MAALELFKKYCLPSEMCLFNREAFGSEGAEDLQINGFISDVWPIM